MMKLFKKRVIASLHMSDLGVYLRLDKISLEYKHTLPKTISYFIY